MSADISSSPTGILIVAGSAALRTGLREIIEPAPDLHVVGELSRCESIATPPDLVLVAIDATLPATPVEGVTACRHHHPPAKIMLLTDLSADAGLAACLQAGATGLFPLNLDAPALIQAIRAVLACGLILHPRAVSAIRPHFTRRPSAAEIVLTDRERQMLLLIAEGATNVEIAATLSLSVSTVTKEISSLLDKLDASNRTAAVARAWRLGLIG